MNKSGHMTAYDWWKYYMDLYTQYLLPENAVVKIIKNPQTGEFEPDMTWFQFASEVHQRHLPPHTALWNHSSMTARTDYAIYRRTYNLED